MSLVFWLAAVLLACAVAAGVLLPLLRRRDAPLPDRLAYDMAVFKDQLAEVDRDMERGLIGADQAEAARLEIKRRMLKDAETPAATAAPRVRRSPALAVGLSLAMTGGALGLYAALGSPDAPDEPLAERGGLAPATVAGGGDGSQLTMEEAVTRLQQRMDANPDSVEGWILLARSYLSMERFPEAVNAFARAFALGVERPAMAADYGEALVAEADGDVTSRAEEMFRTALAADPRDPKSRYYLGLAAAQRGDLKAALQAWIDVIALSPADAPWLPTLRRHVGQAAAELDLDPATLHPSPEVVALAQQPAPAANAPAAGMAPSGPTREDMAAAADMSPEDRAAMVRSMVDRLAARLEAEPDDRAGWLRLARAYDVLGETDKAEAARARAEALADPSPGRP